MTGDSVSCVYSLKGRLKVCTLLLHIVSELSRAFGHPRILSLS